MPKIIDQNELNEILNVIARFPKGISLKKIIENLNYPISERNVYHRLDFLIKKGLIKAEGKTRAKLYKPYVEKQEEIPHSIEIYGISFSLEAEEIQKRVSQPIQARKPVGYNIEFLDEYRPNVSHYLTRAMCEELFEMGKTDGDQPAGTFAKKIFGRLLIDLSWNSSRLEGNTYSLLETERLLALSETVEGKDLSEARMILNHKDAIEFLVDSSPDVGINRPTILNLHALLSNELMADMQACGRLRSIPVGIGKSVYQPLAIPQLIRELFQQILDTAKTIENPFEQSFFLMVHLPYLQPFEDVNKRVSRLAANIPLIQNNLCPLSFIDVPQQIYVNGLLGIYELNRIELFRELFIWAYKRSCLRYSVARKELGSPDPFRMKYYKMISENVVHIVRACMNKKSAIAFIREYAGHSIPLQDQDRFIEEVERDIMSLHEGNIARHRIQNLEYERWLKTWN